MWNPAAEGGNSKHWSFSMDRDLMLLLTCTSTNRLSSPCCLCFLAYLPSSNLRMCVGRVGRGLLKHHLFLIIIRIKVIVSIVSIIIKPPIHTSHAIHCLYMVICFNAHLWLVLPCCAPAAAQEVHLNLSSVLLSAFFHSTSLSKGKLNRSFFLACPY